MKTNNTSRRLVSLLLACIMVLSMMTVGIVATSAANTDVAQTGVTITGGMTFYLKPGSEWDKDGARFAAFFCNGSSGDKWYSAYGPNTDGNYWVTVNPGESNANIIWVRMNGATTDNNWNNKWNQTADLTYDGSKNLFTITDPWAEKAGGSWSVYTPPTVDPTEPPLPTEPTTPWEPGEYTKIAFRDDITSGDKVDTSDADMYVQFNGGSNKLMTKTVDAMSGHDMWYADIPANATSVKFIRASVIDGSTWTTWSPTLSNCKTGLYRATSLGGGAWGTNSESYAIPNKKDINNYSFGIWADTRDKGNLYDLVIARKLSKSEFHLYLPSNAPQNITLYTSFAALKIGDTTVADGTKVTLEGGKSYSIQYRQTSADANYQPATLKVYRTTGTATLVFETKRDLYTGTVGSLSVSGYKDGIETKGSYYLYGEDGTWENAPVTDDETGEEVKMSVLKKIKGRGNSSFEASMKMYGKYAYNFNLDQRVALVDGATATKKWCLLANNVDHSMLRNTFAYSLANDIGLAYSPKTRHVDVYDNGEYLGAYTIIEKVEYGKKTLMNGLNSLDDEHEGWYEDSSIYDEDVDYDDDSVIKSVGSSSSPQSYTAPSGKVYKYKYWTSNNPDFTYEHADDSFKVEFNFLLEHELSERYASEASWFISPYSGQHVVVKYPEFATQKEMKWAMDMYDKLEKAAYDTKTLSAIEAAADAESFAKMYLIQELGLNLDACATSYYIYNDREANKLVAGPTWDFDWSFGSYHKTKITYNGTSSSLDNPRQMYVKDKDINNNISGGQSKKRNLQAQLTQTTDYWTLCKKIWTNDAQPAIKTYIDENTKDSTDTGTLLGWMNDIEASAEMNNIRWNHTYEKDEPEDWGTKLTSNYNKGSYDFKDGTGNSAGSATKSFKNTVYYLNDWIKTRMDYMSNTGGLYDATLLDPVEIKSVKMTATQKDATVSVSAEVIATDDGVDISKDRLVYDLYVGGKLVDTYSVSDTAIVTLEENKKTEIYIVGKVLDENGNVDKTMESDKQSFTYVVAGPEYKVENVKIDAVQSDDQSTVTVKPAATVTCDGEEVKPELVNYTIYLNGAVYGETKTFATPSVDVKLVEGKVNEIYVKVSPADAANVSGTSATEKFSFNVQAEKVSVTLKFKSSSSVRYIPSIQLGSDTITMTKEGEAIAKNASQTQSYYWYTATVEIEKDKATKLTFVNSYSMNASVTLTLSEDATYYYGVNNLNNGTEAVDLTGFAENIRNFVKSATFMLQNDPTATGVATTCLDGKVLKLGDTDEDNTLSVIDATNTQMALAEKSELSETGAALVDYNLDGVNSITDVTAVQIYLAQ